MKKSQHNFANLVRLNNTRLNTFPPNQWLKTKVMHHYILLNYNYNNSTGIVRFVRQNFDKILN